jgi:hypothetical protein
MPARTLPPQPYHAPPRAVLAALVLGWAGLVAAPCLPAAPAMPATPTGEHCGHGGASHDDGGPCAEMLAQGCAVPDHASADGPRAEPLPRNASLLTLPVALADPGVARGDARPGGHAATGPPLTIRYCNLRN